MATKARYIAIRKFFNSTIHTGHTNAGKPFSITSDVPRHAPVSPTGPFGPPHPWRRYLSSRSGTSGATEAKSEPVKATAETSEQGSNGAEGTQKKPPDGIHDQSLLQSYPRFLRRLATSLPHQPHIHRPTRDDFLNVANNMWDRIRIRFKWLTIRGFRKFNADGAYFQT